MLVWRSMIQEGWSSGQNLHTQQFLSMFYLHWIQNKCTSCKTGRHFILIMLLNLMTLLDSGVNLDSGEPKMEWNISMFTQLTNVLHISFMLESAGDEHVEISFLRHWKSF